MFTCNKFHKISFIGKVNQRVYTIRFIISYNYKWFIAFHMKRVGKIWIKIVLFVRIYSYAQKF